MRDEAVVTQSQATGEQVREPAGVLGRLRPPSGVGSWLAGPAGNPFVQLVRGVFTAYWADDIMSLAAEMSYQYLFALFPFFVFLAALLGFIGAYVGHADLFTLVMRFIAILGPQAIQDLVSDWVHGVVYTQSPALLTFGAALSLFGASAGIGTLMKGLHRAHGVRDTRPLWKGQLVSLLATLTLHSVMVVGFVTYAVGGWLSQRMATGYVPDDAVETLWALAHGPGVTIGLFFVLTGFYALLPCINVPVRHAAAGALFATLAWTAITRGFGFYLEHFGQFSGTYGAFATGILLMVWLYAVGTVLLVGGEISAYPTRERSTPR
jgi:membrane protein